VTSRGVSGAPNPSVAAASLVRGLPVCSHIRPRTPAPAQPLSFQKSLPPSAGFPRCPDDLRLCVTLESIDRVRGICVTLLDARL